MTAAMVGFLKVMFMLTGIICLVLSFLIGYKEKATLIAGYDPLKVKDKKRLCRWIGGWLAIAGLFTMCYPWVLSPEKVRPLLWVFCFVIPILIVIVFMITGSGRYEKKRGGVEDRAL